MIIEIKTKRQGWIQVKLLSINKGGTITILIKGNIVKRKIKHVRWGPTYKVAKEQGVSSELKGDYTFKTRKRRNKRKRAIGNKASPTKSNNVPKQRRKVTVIAGHRVAFL